MNPTQYTVKAGDTLNGIAGTFGFKDYKAANIQGYGDNPDKITPGMVLTVGGVPKTQEVPGIGTMTITPKAIPTQTPSNSPGDLTGAYARAGLVPPSTPAPAGTANGYTPPVVAGLPAYGSGVGASEQIAALTKSYRDTLDTITSLEGKISSSAAPSAEEQDLQRKLNDAKAKLASFDVETLSSEEALSGQGRGRTLGTVNTQKTILDRTRALERLGFATEADSIATQLSSAKADRVAQGDIAQTQYTLATKKLDLALGIQDKINSISENERDNARQFLLDTVNFAEGKTYDQLDSSTQQAIIHSVANSPITLGMVKTALATGAERAAAQAAGELRSVSGVGVVQINPKTGTWKVVVPENPNDASPPSNNAAAPSFVDYAASQNFPVGFATAEKLDQLRQEYNAKYGSGTVSLGKLTPTNKNDLRQAALTNAAAPVQSYFLNTPPGFRDQYQRDVAAGKAKTNPSLDDIIQSYTEWYNSQNSGSRDWSKLLGE